MYTHIHISRHTHSSTGNLHHCTMKRLPRQLGKHPTIQSSGRFAANAISPLPPNQLPAATSIPFVATTTTKHWLTLGERLKQEAERKCTSCRETDRWKCQHNVRESGEWRGRLENGESQKCRRQVENFLFTCCAVFQVRVCVVVVVHSGTIYIASAAKHKLNANSITIHLTVLYCFKI